MTAYRPHETTGQAPGSAGGRRRRATGGKIALIAALLVAVATVGGIASFESLTSTATNGSASPYNEFSTGTVVLTDNQSSSAMFSVTNANPGATGYQCIAVEYTGSLTSNVYLFDTVKSDTGLGQDITLSATDGTDTASYSTGSNGDASCTSFSANTNGSFASNATAGDDVNTVNLDDSTLNGSDCTGATGNAAGDCWPTTQATGYQMSYTTGAASPNGTWPDSSSTPTVVWYKFAYAISATAPAGGTVQVELTWEAVGL